MNRSIAEYVADQMARSPPIIDTTGFNKDDRDHVASIDHLLMHLTTFIDQFVMDIELFDYADAHSELTMKLGPVVWRDASMTLWDFGDALMLLHDATKRCRPFRPRKQQVLAVIKQFEQEFPDAKHIRNVAAHPAGHASTPELRRDNSIAGTGVLIQSCCAGRKVMSSHRGREISFEITMPTVTVLKKLRAMAFDVFRSSTAPASGA